MAQPSPEIISETQSLETASGRLGQFVERQTNRAKTLADMAASIGVANTAQVAYKRLRHQDLDREIGLQHDSLRFPVRMCLQDAPNYTEIIRKGAYALPRVYEPLINGKPIIDLGAFVGVAATYFASRYPDSPVTSLEPHPRSFAYLASNAEPYVGQITAVNAAAAVSTSTVGFTAHGRSPVDYMSNMFSPQGDISPSVSALSPDGVLAAAGNPDEIGLLKVDIEGAEKALFESAAMDAILERTGIVLVEPHERYVAGCEAAIAQGTARHGFTPTVINEHTTLYSR